jgi:hypothetical protein
MRRARALRTGVLIVAFNAALVGSMTPASATLPGVPVRAGPHSCTRSEAATGSACANSRTSVIRSRSSYPRSLRTAG